MCCTATCLWFRVVGETYSYLLIHSVNTTLFVNTKGKFLSTGIYPECLVCSSRQRSATAGVSCKIMNMRTPPALIKEEDNDSTNNNNNNNHGIGSPVNEVDFSEYLWMADVELEDFDRQVEEELLEEAFIEACFEEMLAEEEAAQWFVYGQNITEGADVVTLEDAFKSLDIIDTSKPKEEVIVNSKLNPEAPEFVPRYLKS